MMIHQRFRKSHLLLLVSGLLLITLTPIVARHYLLPDMIRRFLTGLGLMLETIAIIKIDRRRRQATGACGS